MKKSIILVLGLILLCTIGAHAGPPVVTVTTNANGFKETIYTFDSWSSAITVCIKSNCTEKATSVCEKQTKVEVANTNTTWSAQRNSNATSTWQQSAVVQQVCVEQPVIVQVPDAPVVYEAPRTVYYSTPYVSVDASVGISSYGGSYPVTYWQENNRWNERANYRSAQRAYGVGGYNTGYGSRLTGENYNSGIRQFQPVWRVGQQPPPMGNQGRRR